MGTVPLFKKTLNGQCFSITRGLEDFRYNTLRNPDSIEWLLNFVTVNPAGVGHQLPVRIAAMADHPNGAAAFSQILFTPQAELSFEALGSQCFLHFVWSI